MNPELSIVMPTFNRMDVLPEVLDALEHQADAPAFEVIIVDDGSSDGTADYLTQRSFTLPTRVVSQANAGPASARNLGTAMARGRLVMYLGDDTVPEPDWLARHWAAHHVQPAGTRLAVLGYTRWHPRMRHSAFLHYINEYGLQFGYAIIADPENVPFNFFYSSNISIPRDLLGERPFNTAFPYPAWEDIELGYRLQRRGLILRYEPRAVVLHDHPTTIDRFADRQEKAGYAAVTFFNLHPELGPFLGIGGDGPPALPSRRLFAGIHRMACLTQKGPVGLAPLWNKLFRYHYLRGLHRGWQARRSGANPG